MGNLRKSNSKLLNLILSLIAFLWMVPFLYVLINFPKGQVEYNQGDFWSLPKGFSIGESLDYINGKINLFAGMENSLLYGIVAGVIAILISALAAYGLTKLKLKGSFYWFLLIYAGTIFPFQMYLVPVYRGYLTTGLYDTQLGMILFYVAISVPFCTFVLRNFFQGVNDDMTEAAKIDGATDFNIFYRIFLPMSKAPISALFLFQFSFIWNDLLFGLTFSQSESVRPVMPVLSILSGTTVGGSTSTPAVLLACLIASIPTMIIYFLLNRNFEEGFVMTSK
ncbi:carbohydrate ABC transporter permease [Listeria costaricensis]|uniref:carbohydrate ABC transporter permease n=1 Tax=Listeria costaricensis TaxID=2026604 RepID=UPI000C07B81F|nr:carbohydrate ABC transporter permease [Listeria costaricensis]